MPKKSSKQVTKKIVKKAVAEVKENPVKESPVKKIPAIRANTKMSQLIEMIKGAEDGSSLKQICEN